MLLVVKRILCHPITFVSFKVNCCGFEEHIVSYYSFWGFKVKMLRL